MSLQMLMNMDIMIMALLHHLNLALLHRLNIVLLHINLSILQIILHIILTILLNLILSNLDMSVLHLHLSIIIPEFDMLTSLLNSIEFCYRMMTLAILLLARGYHRRPGMMWHCVLKM
ncbi:hypothetical protein F5878DRAFT_74053 [Lentinula raphanica]|uniref:Uncharacterized protein n=1 Tax=Lentinula raphanica TaxID=153919 RepID=A0AA38UGK3_9AGAR|nr:hypothetical protein F5878DRAFT_74053 [Lentinula raphanica]